MGWEGGGNRPSAIPCVDVGYWTAVGLGWRRRRRVRAGVEEGTVPLAKNLE